MSPPHRARGRLDSGRLAIWLVLLGLFGGLTFLALRNQLETMRALEARGWRYSWRWSGYRVEGTLGGRAFIVEARRGDPDDPGREPDLVTLRLAAGGSPLYVGPAQVASRWDSGVRGGVLRLANPELDALFPSTGRWYRRDCNLPGDLGELAAPGAPCISAELAERLLRPRPLAAYRVTRAPAAISVYDESAMPKGAAGIAARIEALGEVAAVFVER